MSKLWRRCKRVLRYYYLRILRIHLPVEQVARGVAIGVFVGCLPIVPFHTVTALMLAFIFRASKLASVLCTFFVNPLTMIPFYAMLYNVGKFFMPGSHAAFMPDKLGIKDIVKVGLGQGWDFLHIMIIGGLALGAPLALLAYFASCHLIRRYRENKAGLSGTRQESAPESCHPPTHSPAHSSGQTSGPLSCADAGKKTRDIK